MDLTFRYAEESDTALILQFIRDLADHERMSDEVIATEDTLREWLSDKKKAEVLSAMVDGTEICFALFFHTFLHFWEGPASISRIYMSGRGIGGEVAEKPF